MSYHVERMPFPYAMEWQIVDGNGEVVEIGFEDYDQAMARASELPGSEEWPSVMDAAATPFAENH